MLTHVLTSAINLPKVFLSREYLVASSSALCARPVAPAATCPINNHQTTTISQTKTWLLVASWVNYRWTGFIKGPHSDLEASSLSNQDILLGYPHILKSDAPGVWAPLAHVQLLHRETHPEGDYHITSYQNVLTLVPMVLLDRILPSCQRGFQECLRRQWSLWKPCWLGI